MKDITVFIKEASFDDINKYYVNVDTLEDGEKYWLGFIDPHNDGHAEPKEFIFHGHGEDAIFANPDDDREMYEWTDFINSKDQDEKKQQVAIFKNKSEAKKFCEYYNDIYEM